MVWAFGAMAAAVAIVADRPRDRRRRSELAGVRPRAADSARQVLGVIAGSTIAFTGTVFSITIVALQLASTQFSPRVLRTFLRDRASQHCFGIFVATALYSLMVLREVGSDRSRCPGLAVTGAFVLVVASIFAFVFRVHHVSQSIRAVSIMEAVAAETRASIRRELPAEATSTTAAGVRPRRERPAQVLTLDRGPGDLLGVDEDDLVAHRLPPRLRPRARPDGRRLPAVGRAAVRACTAATDWSPSMRCCPTSASARSARCTRTPPSASASSSTSPRRRCRPPINDPTTAVQCIDRLHDLLRRLAVRPLPPGAPTPTRRASSAWSSRRPTWDDYVHLAFDEIRHFGIGSVQIPRRLRAAIEDLKTGGPAGAPRASSTSSSRVPRRRHQPRVRGRRGASHGVGCRREATPLNQSKALALATAPNQPALGFGVRAKVVAVDLDEAEAGPVPEGPLEVVEQRPVRVAAHVDARRRWQSRTPSRAALDVADALVVVVGADAVLGDEDRHLAR